jgi:hypothetical protein
VPGEIPHKQYLAWLQMKAQANYRKEIFQLTFEDFQQLWDAKWAFKGRGINNYCLSRKDPRTPWTITNVECIPRKQHLCNSGHYKREKKKWQALQTD